MTCYNLSALIGGKFIFFKNNLQDLVSSLNAVISTKESTQIITGHVIYKLAYTYKFQVKTTMVPLGNCFDAYFSWRKCLIHKTLLLGNFE